MSKESLTPEAYFNLLPEERKDAMKSLRETISGNLPVGFSETFDEKGIAYTVPHTLYPEGYHCNPKQPLPFIHIASQKTGIALHHLGIYADTGLSEWITLEYPKHSKTKLDMGKGCLKFKKADQIPFDLIAELAKKTSPQEWIATYEKLLKK